MLVLLVMCLALYPIAELTRVIWTISYAYDPDRLATWIAETVIMWIMYLAIIPVSVYASRRHRAKFDDKDSEDIRNT